MTPPKPMIQILPLHLFLLNTDKKNIYYFTSTEIQGAYRSRSIKQETGWIITTYFKFIVSKQELLHSKISMDYISRAELIYGPETPFLQGKTTKIQLKGIKTKWITFPLSISQHHSNINLYMEIFM